MSFLQNTNSLSRHVCMKWWLRISNTHDSRYKLTTLLCFLGFFYVSIYLIYMWACSFVFSTGVPLQFSQWWWSVYFLKYMRLRYRRQFDMESKFDAVKTNHNWDTNFKLKSQQVEIVTKLQMGRHVFAILPTGLGRVWRMPNRPLLAWEYLWLCPH